MEGGLEYEKTGWKERFPIVYRFHEEYEFTEDVLGEEDHEHPLSFQDRIELKSVGIDIGSSTSHLIFSRLELRRMGANLSSRYIVVKREPLWKSDILLTPYRDHYYTIDTETLSRFITDSYRQAGFAPEDIDAGAVIITGEAARKENAEAITSLFSKEAGKFVCAVAGHNMEATLSAYGSGGVQKSLENGDESSTIMVVDVGGGTCKIALAQRGAVIETAAINVGSRLISFDNESRITRLEEAARIATKELGMDLKIGMSLSVHEKQEIVKLFTRLIFNLFDGAPLSPLVERLMLTPPLSYKGSPDLLLFCGGVAEYIYDLEQENYGDLGNLFGEEIRKNFSSLNLPVGEPVERIRATVIGASQYTIQVSGNTIFISRHGILPLRNLRVVTPHWEDGQELPPPSIERSIRKAFNRLDLQEGEKPAALALHWPFGPRYEMLKNLAQGILFGLKETIRKKLPIILVFDGDVGKLVGNLLQREFGIETDIISVDMVELREFDHIDLGEQFKKSGTVPIVIKSLVF